MVNCAFGELNKTTIQGHIIGSCLNREVLIEGRKGYKLLSPEASQKLYNHSPDGFAWGYGGSGPAQLALAILLEIFGEEVALSHYQAFKNDIIAKQNSDQDLELAIQDVFAWVAKYNF